MPAVVAGLDIGGTRAKFGLWDVVAGAPRGDAWIDTVATPEPAAVVRQFAAALAVLQAANGVPTLRGVGIACAGYVDAARGVVQDSPNLPGFRDAPLADLARAAFPGLRCVIDNDANACGFAEARAGAARDVRSALCVTWGTGIGGALVLDGQLWRGRHGFAGEIGHTSCAPAAGVRCACGRDGCVEAAVSSARLVALAAARGVTDDDGAAPRTVEALAACATRGDTTAAAILHDAGVILGDAIGNVIDLLDIECCVVGGGVAHAGDVVFAGIREGLAARAVTAEGRATPVRPARFGAHAGWIGAALLAAEAHA